MDYKRFSATDFADDLFFIQWVREKSPEGGHFWEAFLLDHPEKAEEIEEAKNILRLLDIPVAALPDEEVDGMRNNILDAIHAPAKKPTWRFWMRCAAIISIPFLFLALVFFVRQQYTPARTQIASETSPREKRVNLRGQRSVLLLPDGTRVWLNADSHLDFARDFTAGAQRDVYLEGEAYFDVVRHADKPFIVHTATLAVKVLGTGFNVKSYPTDRTVETILVHGRISLTKADVPADDGGLILEPGQRAVFSKETKTMVVEQVAAERATTWRFNKLVFDETPFGDAIAQLERWYDIKIHVADSSDLHCGLTAEIEHENLDQVLKLLEITHHVRCTLRGKEVFIDGTLCH